MKKFILAAALLLSAISAGSTVRFNDPVPECPPNCGSGNDTNQVNVIRQ